MIGLERLKILKANNEVHEEVYNFMTSVNRPEAFWTFVFAIRIAWTQLSPVPIRDTASTAVTLYTNCYFEGLL